MKLQIIQLEPYDDVVSVRDRLSFVKAERVLLVWPRLPNGSASILRRKLDLVLIQREAARRGTRLALVTTDPEIMDRAAELNISTFESVRASQQGRWKHPRNKVFVDRSDRPDNAPDAHELRLLASRLVSQTPRQRLTRRVTRIVVSVVLAATVLTVAAILVPGAEVQLFPSRSQIDATVALTADPSLTFVDVERGRIPATLDTLDVEAQASIPTTGIKDVPGAVASGSVIFTNQTNSDVSIPPGTIVSTAASRPARFRTTAEALVPGGIGKRISVTIQAAEGTTGAAGNVDAGLIVNVEGPLASSLTARNPEATRGGAVRQQAVVAQADYDSLLLLGRERLRQAALSRFSSRLSGTQFVAPDSIKIVREGSEEATYSAFVGDAAESLSLVIRARIQALILDDQTARQAALARLSGKIPAGWRLLPETVVYTRGAVQPPDAKGQVALTMTASADVAAIIDAERARQRIAGLSAQDALNLLNRDWLLDPLRPPRIQVFPQLMNGFFGRLPLMPMRINVAILEVGQQ